MGGGEGGGDGGGGAMGDCVAAEQEKHPSQKQHQKQIDCCHMRKKAAVEAGACRQHGSSSCNSSCRSKARKHS